METTQSDSSSSPVQLICQRAAQSDAKQPLSCGVPFARGAVPTDSLFTIGNGAGSTLPVQSRVLQRWPDGSVRWAHFEWIDSAAKGAEWSLYWSPSPGEATKATATANPLSFSSFDAEVDLDGAIIFLSKSGDRIGALKLTVDLTEGQPAAFAWSPLCLEDEGPICTRLKMAGRLRRDSRLQISLELCVYPALNAIFVKAEVTNPHAAAHRGGRWGLGTTGSIYFDDISLLLEMAEPLSSGTLSPGRGHPSLTFGESLALFQASSGGANWDSLNHINRDGAVPLAFSGCRLDIDTSQQHIPRASPLLSTQFGQSSVALCPMHFWQNFPSTLNADGALARIGLFPREHPDRHEIQGGERKTHAVWLRLSPDHLSSHDEWLRTPAIVSTTPAWNAYASALPFITPSKQDPQDPYLMLINAAIEGPDTFNAKRERMDEYGWRNFGDIPADHEQTYYRGKEPLISHYNNQYDIVLGLGTHYLRSGDPRWFDEMQILASHVRDIDIYHTDEDVPAYNRGMFWHTAHDVSAETSNHRTYPLSGAGGGGGPSCEHLYASGLALHYWLTGERSSRDCVLELGQFVIDADDGRLTPLKWISQKPTGLASRSGAPDYHGPGRGSGNALRTLLDAYSVSEDEKFLIKAGELVRRCVHPDDDPETHRLREPEIRWFYMVFLRSLCGYLLVKHEHSQFDDDFHYARDSLLRYVRWMCKHEYFYLDKPDRLLEPTETWAAQEFRKSEVLDLASLFADSSERATFHDKAAYFFERAESALSRSETRTFARPVALALTFGAMRSAFCGKHAPALDAPYGTPINVGRRRQFVPQRADALRRGVAGLCIALMLAAVWL